MIKEAKPIGPTTVIVGSVQGPYQCSIDLLSESGVDDGAYYPAQHISIHGDKAIKSLIDFCSSILEEFEKEKQTNKQS